MTLQRTGRAIVYTNQVPYETDVLRTNMYRMADISTLAQSVIGLGVDNATRVAGGDCTPNLSPDLSVLIAPITIYQLDDYDATDYGVIPADTTNQLYKQGYNLATTHVTGFAAPGSGTRYYLVQAALATNDVNSVSRPYYNSADPSQPAFDSQPDTRVDSVNLTIKFNTVSTPAPDAGFVGLWAVTVTNGQTTITSGDISEYPGAPFITNSIANAVDYNDLQQSFPIYWLDTGAANAYEATPTIEYQTYVAGTLIYLKVANQNTGASTLNISGLGTAPIIDVNGNALFKNSMPSIAQLIYNGSSFVLMNSLMPFNSIYCSLTQGSNQTISVNSPTVTVVNFDTVDHDPYSMANTGSKEIVIPFAGRWSVAASVATTGGTGLFDIDVYQNGAQKFRLGQNSTVSGTVGGYCEITAAAADIIQIVVAVSDQPVQLNAASTAPIHNFFQVRYLGNA